jgi:hypothetical protein
MPSTTTITPEDKARIRLVAEALRRRAAESEILSALVGSGVAQEAAAEFYCVVAHGLKTGVTAGVTEELSAQQYQRGESALWDAAFEEGRRQFGGAACGVWLQRVFWGSVALQFVALVAIFVGLLARGYKHRWGLWFTIGGWSMVAMGFGLRAWARRRLRG